MRVLIKFLASQHTHARTHARTHTHCRTRSNISLGAARRVGRFDLKSLAQRKQQFFLRKFISHFPRPSSRLRIYPLETIAVKCHGSCETSWKLSQQSDCLLRLTCQLFCTHLACLLSTCRRVNRVVYTTLLNTFVCFHQRPVCASLPSHFAHRGMRPSCL